jgi:hypothetical protein
MFQRPEHRLIASALAGMDADLLVNARCYFGGGTAIVLQNREYRRSLDVDFLCADVAGYRELRSRVTDRGIVGLFRQPVRVVRDIRSDQYGIRAFLALDGLTIKFEIIREARISLSGLIDPDLCVPVLEPIDQFAEKLLANADRGLDASTAHRDAIDLGILCGAHGGLPEPAVGKAERAYGVDIRRKLLSVLFVLDGEDTVRRVAKDLDMDVNVVISARNRLAAAVSEAFGTADGS